MRATIQLPDEVYDAYTSAAEGMAGLGKALSPEEVMVDRLTRFKEVSAQDRVVVVDPRSRARLETLLSGGSLLDAEDLVRKVQGLCDVKVGEIRLDFTPAETRKITHWANRQNKPAEFILKEIVDRIKMTLFDLVPGS